MKILYVILAHDEPESLYDLALTLTNASTESDILIHFDAGACEKDTEKLKSLIDTEVRISVVDIPIKCNWGTYSLVAGTLHALRQATEQPKSYDYVVLLSGACRPCRSVSDLEQFLNDNNGKEFIEISDEHWITDGLRKERYEFFFPFGASKNYSPYERRWVQLQKLLGVKRKAPNGMTIRFGSQWWALTWPTCIKILAYLDANSRIERFFKNTYIPDEMFFQTMVTHLISKDHIAGSNLTFYQFNPVGKPIVFYDDHEPITFSLNKFFYRKVSPDATRLKTLSLQVATENTRKSNETTNDLVQIGGGLGSSPKKTGELFCRDQFSDRSCSALASMHAPYIFIIGSLVQIKALSGNINTDYFQSLGRLFSRHEVFENAHFEQLGGLKKTDLAIRDMHPALYLCRARERAEKVPLIFWHSDDCDSIISDILQDSNALSVILTPDEIKEYGNVIALQDHFNVPRQKNFKLGDDKLNVFSCYEWFKPFVNMLK